MGDMEQRGQGDRRWLQRWAVPVLAIAATVLYTASGVVQHGTHVLGHAVSYAAMLIALGVAASLSAAVLAGRRQRRLERLEAEREVMGERADAGDSAIVGLLLHELEALTAAARHASNERVSVFRRDDDGFTLVARYSLRPSFRESTGRRAYPLGEGLLGLAWEEGSAEAQLPPPGEAGKPPTRAWCEAQVRRGQIPRATAAALSMRTQSYALFRIGSPRPLGVLVFESTLAIDDRPSGSGPLLTLPELEAAAAAASERLQIELRESYVLGPERIHEVLTRLQRAPRRPPLTP